jgi:hypothetical protein
VSQAKQLGRGLSVLDFLCYAVLWDGVLRFAVLCWPGCAAAGMQCVCIAANNLQFAVVLCCVMLRPAVLCCSVLC